ncbi:hypothetical protein O6H91_15G038500 [Diphasiastrum complanatum]|uniref:Uncharacterized protein n=1 Tax=Diphasiastrum complanatum TaxID=34168 RepID=A0ACC2BIF1_DIPCM|nr:hypothetical protein O6H91_15G038500 [Diphasiastrum complanatum]
MEGCAIHKTFCIEGWAKEVTLFAGMMFKYCTLSKSLSKNKNKNLKFDCRSAQVLSLNLNNTSHMKFKCALHALRMSKGSKEIIQGFKYFLGLQNDKCKTKKIK